MRLSKFIRQLGFFQTMAVLFLLITAVGFARSFYLRPIFDLPALPVIFHIHGFFTTAWVVLFLVQSFLIAGNKYNTHRKLGLYGAIIAFGVLISGLVILHYIASGYPQNGRDITQISALVWGNLAILLAFSIFVISGIALRFRPLVHKRLMLLATLSFMGQPLSRIGHYEMFRVSESIILNDVVYGLGGMLLLYTILIIHDLIKLRKVHLAIILGMPLQLGLTILAGLWIANTEFGQGFILLFN